MIEGSWRYGASSSSNSDSSIADNVPVIFTLGEAVLELEGAEVEGGAGCLTSVRAEAVG